MRKYHIVFKDKESDLMSKGENYLATDIVAAYGMFLVSHPMAYFISLYDLDALNNMRSAQM